MPALSLTEFADKMGEILPSLMHEFARRQTNELYRGTISLPQFLVLEYLYLHRQAKMTELARFLRVTTPAMTGAVERLVHSDFLQRVFDPKDRRIVMVKLTSKGETTLKKINLQRRKMVLDIFGRLSEKDRADYLKILLHIRDVLANVKERKPDA